MLHRFNERNKNFNILSQNCLFIRQLPLDGKAQSSAPKELSKDIHQEIYESVNDDLEKYYTRLRLFPYGKWIRSLARTYFLPKLTEAQLKLVKSKDEAHFRTYFKNHDGSDPDVSEAAMARSESRSKFAFVACIRQTLLLNDTFGIIQLLDRKKLQVNLNDRRYKTEFSTTLFHIKDNYNSS